jgi:hypothetical protein
MKDLTLPNKEIYKIVKTFSKNKYEAIFDSIRWIKKNMKKIDFDKKFFRKRDASEIVNSKEFMGCTDLALVFLSFMNALNINASYIETVSKDTLQELNKSKTVKGHIFVRVKLEKISMIVDPTSFQIFLGDSLPTSSMFPNSIIIGEGKDFSELGLFNTEDIEKFAQKKLKTKVVE